MPESSPLPKMTVAHFETLVLLDARALTKEECVLLAEIAALIRSLVSGEARNIETEDLEFQYRYALDAYNKAAEGWDKTRLWQIAEWMRETLGLTSPSEGLR